MMSEVENELRKVTWLLFKVDKDIRYLEDQKKSLREHFLELASKQVEETQHLARKTLHLHPSDPLEDVLRLYPGWRVLSQTRTPESLVVVLEEDPQYLKFSYINPDNHLVFSRIIATVGQKFQTERFCEDHPDLALECVKTVHVLDEDKAQKLAQNDPYMLSLFQDYTTPGKPQIRLGAPRKATEDDR